MATVVVIIPAKDEANTIEQVINRIPKGYYCIVVDDGSKDNTKELAERAGAYVLRNLRSKGVGVAFRKGLDLAITLEPDVIVNIDADGQMFPEDIPRLVNPILEGKADVIIATRFHYKHIMPHIPFTKRLGNKLFTRLVNFITKENFTDSQCGFRAYNLEAAKRMFLLGEFTYTQESLLDLSEKGFVIRELPLYIKGQRKGKSRVVKNVFNYGLNALFIIFRTVRDYHPFKFFLSLSLFTLLLSLGSAGFVVYRKVHEALPFSEQNYIILITIMVFFISLALGFIGILADMNGRLRRTEEEVLYRLK